VLSDDFERYDDAAEGPLEPGDSGHVTHVEGRIKVGGWWYSAAALRRDPPSKLIKQPTVAEKQSWFKEGDVIRTAKAIATIQSWDPESNTLTFHNSVDMAVRRSFKPGQVIDRVDPKPPSKVAATLTRATSTSTEESSTVEATAANQAASHREPLPPICVYEVLEEPQAVQMKPYLRPKATTCAKTLYLPKDYDSAEHLLETFTGAFSDAKLGGMYDE
jgi:hypothetical protein